jgi:hypothetical protein
MAENSLCADKKSSSKIEQWQSITTKNRMNGGEGAEKNVTQSSPAWWHGLYTKFNKYHTNGSRKKLYLGERC